MSYYYGVVEDIHDPDMKGRVRVRWNTLHTQQKIKDDRTGIPTQDLPWCTVMQSTMSASTTGIGAGPHGLVQGCWVIGIMRESMCQSAIVIGSVPAMSDEAMVTPNGFVDPNNVYPLADLVGEPDVNRLARNQNIAQTIVSDRRNSSVEVPIAGEVPPDAEPKKWTEPESSYDAQYPYNKVYETTAGHIIEIDDTPGASRIHVYHSSGTFMEMRSDGGMVTKVGNNNTQLVYGDNNLLVTGDMNLTVNGNVCILSNHDLKVDTKGNMAFRALGDISFEAANIKHTSRGKYDIVTKTSEVAIAETLLTKTGSTLDLTTGGTMNVTSEDELNINSSGTMDIVGAGEINITGGQVDIVGDPVTINNEDPTEATIATQPTVTDTSIPVGGFEMEAYDTPVGRASLVNLAGPGADRDDDHVSFTQQFPYIPMNGMTPEILAVANKSTSAKSNNASGGSSTPQQVVGGGGNGAGTPPLRAGQNVVAAEVPPPPADAASGGMKTPVQVSPMAPIDISSGIDYEMDLGGGFKLKHLTTKTLYPYKIPPGGNNGKSAQQIIENLRQLVTNILIPLSTKFPGLRINSGFRAKSGGSQHNIGQAVDVSWPGVANANAHAMEVYKWARENLPYDQMISERISSMWIHFSYNPALARQRHSTISTPNGKPPYSHGFITYSHSATWGGAAGQTFPV